MTPTLDCVLETACSKNHDATIIYAQISIVNLLKLGIAGCKWQMVNGMLEEKGTPLTLPGAVPKGQP